jgi:hypothetical protein
LRAVRADDLEDAAPGRGVGRGVLTSAATWVTAMLPGAEEPVVTATFEPVLAQLDQQPLA